MSFILDALKKLEQKRQRGSIPDLMTFHSHAAHEPQKRPIWPYVVIAALMLNAAILAVWLLPRDSETPAKMVQTEVVQKDTKPDRLPREYARSTPPPVYRERVKSVNREPVASADALTRKQDDQLPDVSDDQVVETFTGQEVATDNIRVETDTTASLSILQDKEEIEILRENIRREKEQLSIPEPDRAESEIDLASLDESESGNTIVEYNNLPPSIKEEIPDIAISTHVYSNKPRARIVTINGRLSREGETTNKGIVINEITMSGVILDYKGHRFRMRAF